MTTTTRDGAQSTPETRVPAGAEQVVEKVKERYGRIAEGGLPGCCGSSETRVTLSLGYGKRDIEGVPQEANLGLGCGAPIAALDLRPGETVLDLGSGAGLDVFLAARQVGPTGRAIGVDMTPAMLERARAAADKAGLRNVEFRRGRLESLPLADASVDAVTSNCVINLVPDKAAVFREVARVLRPGGRLVISDIVLDGRLPERIETDLLAYMGCISGAAQRADYFATLAGAGLSDVVVLKDVDYLALAAEAEPEQARALLERTGTRREEVLGIVRSLTFRAVKPSA